MLLVVVCDDNCDDNDCTKTRCVVLSNPSLGLLNVKANRPTGSCIAASAYEFFEDENRFRFIC